MTTISLSTAKRRLTVLWGAGAGLLIGLMIVQTLGSHYDDAAAAWSWLIPRVVPTLSLIIGVLVIDALGKGTGDRQVDGFMYRLTVWLSVIYFAIVIIPILVQPMTEFTPEGLLKLSDYWVVPMQGLVTAALAAFFVKES